MAEESTHVRLHEPVSLSSAGDCQPLRCATIVGYAQYLRHSRPGGAATVETAIGDDGGSTDGEALTLGLRTLAALDRAELLANPTRRTSR
jgi:hypothetical protein